MAFPSITAPTTTSFSTSVTSMAVNLPASISAGDLLIAGCEVRNLGTWTLPTNWVELGSASAGVTGELTIFYKIADGTETSTATWTASLATTAMWEVRKVTSWHGSTVPEMTTNNSAGTTNLAPDPASITATWGAEDNLFIEYVGTTAETITGMVGLLNHTPNTGTGWNLIWRGSTNLYSAINSSNQGQVPISIANQGIILEADTTYSSADYSVEMTLSAGFTTTNRGYLIVRMLDQENMYAFRFSTGASASRLYKKVSGTWTALGSGLIADPAVGDVVKLDVSGTTLTVYYNGVSKQTATDSALSSAGKAGLAFGGGTELVASSDDTNVATRFDGYKVILGGSTIFEDTFTFSSSEYGSEGYSNGSFNAVSTGGSAASIASAVKTSTSATENPSEFPHSNTRYWQSATIVVRPSSGVVARRIFIIT